MIKLFKNKREIRISPSIVVFSVFYLLLLYLLYLIRGILTVLFLAFIIMVALNPAVNKLHRRLKIPRVVSIIIVYILLATSIAALVGLIIPPLARQLAQLVKSVNLPYFQDKIRNLSFTVAELNQIADRVGTSLSAIMSIISVTFSSVFTFFTLLVMSFYLMLDRPRLHLKTVWFSKEKRHINLTKDILDSIENQLGGWVRGQIVLMTLIGVITYLGLALLSVPFALPLAIVAGLLEILPNIGPTVAAIPAVILAFFFLGPVMAGVVILFYVVVQQLENNLIVPKIMQQNAQVNPLISILSILIGFKLYSVVGALLAVPTYIVLRTLYSYWLKNNHDGMI